MKTNTLIWLFMIVTALAAGISCKEKRGLPSVVTVAVTDIADTHARIEINVTSDGGGAGEDFGGILFSNVITEPVWPEDWNIGGFGNVGPGTHYDSLTYLTPGSIYYVRAIAWNNVGIAYGDVLSFKTTGTVTGEIGFNPEVDYGTVTDIEGNIYKTVQIGNQTWMAENLRTRKLSDGSDIQEVSDFKLWAATTDPALCYYVNDRAKHEQNYGALYNWYAVETDKLCPEGWHVPSDEEWSVLSEYLGGSEAAGPKLRETGYIHWVKSDSTVTNSSGFTALPGGYKGDNTNVLHYFFYLGYHSSFWSSTITQANSDENLSSWGMTFQPFGLMDGTGVFGKGGGGLYWLSKRTGISVRCVKD